MAASWIHPFPFAAVEEIDADVLGSFASEVVLVDRTNFYAACAAYDASGALAASVAWVGHAPHKHVDPEGNSFLAE